MRLRMLSTLINAAALITVTNGKGGPLNAKLIRRDCTKMGMCSYHRDT